MCGIAMVRLLKPLEYYQMKYGTWQYGFQKLYLLMEKQHNRGQEGAGMASVKLDMPPGDEYISRERALGSHAIDDLFSTVNGKYAKYSIDQITDPAWAKQNLPFAGEVYMGHLRYSTTGKDGLSYVHPFLRRNNWQSRNLILAGNFNMTNVDDIFGKLVEQGQHPRDCSDTFLVLEQLGHYLDREVQHLYDKYEGQEDITDKIENDLNLGNILRKASPVWDGGYSLCGMTGSGDSFVFRDPWGIRPAFYYADDEIVVMASERPVIQTTLNLEVEDVKELKPGEAIIVKKSGKILLEQVLQPKKNITPCSFERIYFSRGSDKDIYQERKKLGELLTEPILNKVDHDLDHTVFSFIPNTAETAFYGMFEGMQNYMIEGKKKLLAQHKNMSDERILEILNKRPRIEKVVIKDIKLRTFIAQDAGRNDLAAHVYDITYNSIVPGQDNLVVIDDSIVRGTTLKQSIIKILDRLGPKKIVVVSSCPQIRYPDCYGIDMSRMSEFIAFRAAIELLKETGNESVINSVYKKCMAQQNLPKEQIVNYVKEIYEPFTADQISAKIAQMITPENNHAQVDIVYQTLEGLHNACPNNGGDWYFSGNYPTPGGNRVVNNAYINYIEGKDKRSY